MGYQSIARTLPGPSAQSELLEYLSDEINIRLDMLVESRGINLDEWIVVYSPMKELDGLCEMTAVIMSHEEANLSTQVPVSEQSQSLVTLSTVLAKQV